MRHRSPYKVLPVMDNLDRAMFNRQVGRWGQRRQRSLVEGVQMNCKSSSSARWRSSGKARPSTPRASLSTAGAQAVSQLETDKVPPGGVASVFSGAIRWGALLRPAWWRG